MDCRNCSNPLDLIDRFDTGSGGNVRGKAKDKKEHQDICFNLYICGNCGAICKENVWDNKGQLWVFEDNSTETIPAEKV